jgi:lysophospholipase L1-like esterase
MKKLIWVLLLGLALNGCYEDDGAADSDVDEFRISAGVGQTILFLGDSRIQMGNFEKYLPNTIINYGRYGATTKGVLNRIPYITQFPSDWIVLHIGANDINERRTQSLIDNYREILVALVRLNRRVIILETVNTQYDEFNIFIEGINTIIKPYALSLGFHWLEFPEMLDENRRLKDEYSCSDGIHFSEASYELVSAKINTIVNGDSNEE